MQPPCAHLAFAGFIALASATTKPDRPKLDDFDWTTITPSRKLEYHPCYTEFQCARLVVPLDWLNESNPHTVALAITKLPAVIPETDPAFGGAVFANPGGPGGSGVGLMLAEGHVIQGTVDSETRKYEVVSWDPRAVQFTTPRADCYEDLFARGVDANLRQAIGPPDRSLDALRRQWARFRGYGKLCTQNVGEASIIPYATTASTVRDMVEMLDRVQELRDEESAARVGGGDKSQKPMRRRDGGDVPRLQYWGFSYGSFLGNTFASMYPGRVGRVMLDGVVDAGDYVNGGWSTDLQDTEELIDFFYQTCFAAGSKCALNRASDAKWQDVRSRVDDLVTRLDEAPVSILDGKLTNILTGYDVINAFRGPMYRPHTEFVSLATQLNSAVEGNYTALLRSQTQNVPPLEKACDARNGTFPPSTLGEGGQSILCGDAEDKRNWTLADFRDWVSMLTDQSPTFAGSWSQIILACMAWDVRPKWRFTGPFTTPEHDASLVEGKPAAPVLFLSSRLDPVTPLRNAHKMSESHPGSVVLVQNSPGHCAGETGSRCTSKVIQEYLEHGRLPEKGTVCEPDCSPWDGHACLPSTQGITVAAMDGY
ncbi:Tripeptidyl aminopeptidase [Colletotrichum trifolii]|uniref:Tripeptidyl aminopeptidase n=1 Tax=Colletotrichum trifolii TaxID=5466 RepID=A0A4R8QNK0_COLTR|nr:Tripeptidyl aminopeptidase [Colletotrichum trifolii]